MKPRNNPKSQKNKRSRYINKNHAVGEVTYSLPRSRTIVPDSLITNLKFIDQSQTVIKNTLSNLATVRFRPSCAYDVDPTLGSTATPGFKELSFLYGKYRVLSSTMKVHFTNLESAPVNVVIWPTNFDLGANYGFVAAAIAAPFAKSTTLSRAGGIDMKTLSRFIRTADIFGTDEVLYDDDFAAANTSIPVNNWFWNVGLWAPTLTFLTSGVQALIEIDMQVQMTERIMITN